MMMTTTISLKSARYIIRQFFPSNRLHWYR